MYHPEWPLYIFIFNILHAYMKFQQVFLTIDMDEELGYSENIEWHVCEI